MYCLSHISYKDYFFRINKPGTHTLNPSLMQNNSKDYARTHDKKVYLTHNN